MTAALAPKPLDLNDYLSLSVGSLNRDFRGKTGIKDGVEVSLDILADNLAVLNHFVGGDDIRWLVLTSETAIIPFDRTWKAIQPLAEVENISMGHKVVRSHAVDTTGFEGQVDYVLLNLLKTRQMVVVACFDHDGDATLHKMRS